LLYNFLEEFLYLLDAENFILAEIKSLEIKKDKNKNKQKKFILSASVFGDKATNYEFSNDVKAITYNDMKVLEKNSSAEIIFVVDV
jgi:SHS2 domain-containing protein